MPQVRNLRKLKLSRVDLVPKGSNPGAHIALFKAAPDDDATNSNSPESSGPTNSKENPMSQTATETTAEATDATTAEVENTETAGATTETTENTGATAETTATETAPEPVAAGVEKAEPETITKAEAEAIRKENAELRADVEKMAADKREAEFITKAEKECSFIGDPNQTAKWLMLADEHFEKADYDAFETMFKSISEQVEQGNLFGQFTKSDAEPTDRETELEKAANELIAKGEAKTIEQARVAAMDANPALRPDNTTARS